MSRQAPGSSSQSWAEDQYDEHAELIALTSEVFGITLVPPPSHTPSRTDAPPPTQSTPTPHKKSKKKCKNEDPHTPHGPRPALSSDAGSADKSEEVSPSPGPQSSSSKGKAPPPRPVAFDAPPPLMPWFFPKAKHSGNLVAMLERTNNTLLEWCKSSCWEDTWDRMHIARHLALTLRICTQSGWHVLPFSDKTGTPTLASSLPSVGLVIPATLGPFCRLAESSAGPAPMDLDAPVLFFFFFFKSTIN
jgi:hypothetical protein